MPEAHWGAALWGAIRSAIMRRHRRIRRWVGLSSVLLLALLVAPVSGAAEAPSDSVAHDSEGASAAWLPDPIEIVDMPERRDEPPEGSRLRAQTGWGGAAPAVHRIWWNGGGRPISEVAFSSGSKNMSADGGGVARWGGLRIGAGALALPQFGLLGETTSLTRRIRSFGAGGGSSRPEAMSAATGSGADLAGAAIAWRGTARLALGRLRRASGDVVALDWRRHGLAARGVWVRRDGRTAGSGGLAFETGTPATRATFDFAAGPAGIAARFDAAARAGPVRGAARWRYEEGRERPSTLDFETAWHSYAAAARFRWRSWSVGGSAETPGTSTARGGADDGRAELDLRLGRGGAGALLVRIGSRPKQDDGSGGERFAIGDLVVAREAGRTLRLTAGDRLVQAGEGWRRGRAMGAVLELERRRRASLTLTAEMVRAEDGAGSYGTGLDVAGGGSIRARTRSGFRAAARGWIGFGAWRCGMAVDDESAGGNDGTTAGAARAPRVNLWLAWSGGADAP